MAAKKPIAVGASTPLSEIDPATDTLDAKLQVSATGVLLGRNTAGAGAHEQLSASAALDLVGSTRGSILYRGASAWNILGPGTSGHVLTSNGAGADPSYQAAAGGGGSTIVVKTADESVNNSTTFQADDHLTFSCPANKKAVMNFFLFLNNGHTAEFKCRVAASGATTVRGGGTGAFFDYSYTFNQDSQLTSNAIRTYDTNGATQELGFMQVSGYVEAGASARTVVLEWAQAVATAKNTQILAGSWVEYRIID